MQLFPNGLHQESVYAGSSLITVNAFDSTLTVGDIVNAQIKHSDFLAKEDAFYVVNLGDVAKKFHLWRERLPRVEPFYAVKCNDDMAVLQTLASLGTGFDCASKNEIKSVISLGVTTDRIIYAHPCKTVSHITFAAEHDVNMTTFDNEPELHKIQRIHPRAQLVLRIRADDPKAVCNLGIKFGAKLPEAKRLLGVAKDLQLNVIGVSFHVGSGCTNALAYSQAIQWAKEIFDYAATLNMKLTMLDLGGGFPGQPGAPITFEEICEELVPALDLHFPAESGVRIIAEPGRFFVASAFTLCVNIIAKRVIDAEQRREDEEGPKFMYYINDGVYGSFNCLLYDHASVEVKVPPFYVPSELHRASIWGPTCDGIDCISKKTWLPEMDIGQWLIFEDMGAYTCAASSTFNGFARPYMMYVAPLDCGIVQVRPPHLLDQQLPRTSSEFDESTSSEQIGLSLEEVLMQQQSIGPFEEALIESAPASLSCAVECDSYEIPSLPEVGIFCASD